MLTQASVIARMSAVETGYDLLLYVAPHRVPKPVAEFGSAPVDGWIRVDPRTLEMGWERVWAIGDVTRITLPSGKLLPKAGVLAHRAGDVAAERTAAAFAGRAEAPVFDGHGECFIEMGGGIAGFARGNFYAEPVPVVRTFRPGRHWHLAKIAFERSWWPGGGKPKACRDERWCPARRRGSCPKCCLTPLWRHATTDSARPRSADTSTGSNARCCGRYWN